MRSCNISLINSLILYIYFFLNQFYYILLTFLVSFCHLQQIPIRFFEQHSQYPCDISLNTSLRKHKEDTKQDKNGINFIISGLRNRDRIYEEKIKMSVFQDFFFDSPNEVT